MKYENILELLKKHKVSSYRAMVACSCDEAWKTIKESGVLEIIPDFDYEQFCDLCNSVWLSWETGTGLTSIADAVANYIIEMESIPDPGEDYDNIMENTLY